MKNSHIEWTDHTFNPWEGCTKVSPGCAHCYAETRNARFGGGQAPNWGKGAPRRRTSGQNWNEPRKWNKAAAVDPAAIGRPWEVNSRPRVFCASLADVGDMEVPIEWFAELLQLIFECQNLDWQLLSKRPETWMQRVFHAALYMAGYRDGQTSENPTAKAMSAWEWVHDWVSTGTYPANVWMGTTVEDQDRADERIPALLAIPARVRFLSCEPLLGAVDLGNHSPCGHEGAWAKGGLNWVICGGESGPGARPMHPDWARSLRDQCADAGVPFLFKQWGEWAPWNFNTWSPNDYPNHVFGQGEGAESLSRVGKASGGRLLDGVEHNAFPEVRS